VEGIEPTDELENLLRVTWQRKRGRSKKIYDEIPDSINFGLFFLDGRWSARIIDRKYLAGESAVIAKAGTLEKIIPLAIEHLRARRILESEE